MPGRYDTTLYIGDNWQRTVVITDPAGAAVDLTGYAAKWQARTEKTATTAVLTLSTTTGEIVIDGTTLTASCVAAVTALLNVGSYYHDLQLTSPGGVITTYLAGVLTVAQDVTR